MSLKAVFAFFTVWTASVVALAATQPKEACYVLKTQDISSLTLQVPTEVCFGRVYVSIDEKLVLASGRKTPELVVDLTLSQLRKTSEQSYAFTATSNILDVVVAECEKSESIKLEVTGSTNEFGETNSTLFRVRVSHKVQEKACTTQNSDAVYEYVLSTR